MEIVVVLLILGVLAVFSVIGFTEVTNVRVRAAADKLKADLQYAQGLAMKTRVACGVTFSGNTYTVFENNDTNDPAEDPLTKADYTVTLDAAEYKRVTITSATFGATSTVKFDREGTPSDGSDNALPSAAASRQVVLSSNTNVVVAQTTGKVTVE